ncbi:MAG: hypothetical protein U9N56_07845 [Actinomycetota bacterium]|nr:hypothetical protein [Actinomycetota bacterium]
MIRILRRLRFRSAGIILATMATACGSISAVNDPVPWGDEAIGYFDELAVAYTANDYYGVLDFYSPNAFQERWRGGVRGGLLVRDLLRWNSGDLGYDIVDIHLGPQGALALIRSDTAGGGLSVVVSTLEDGLITEETVYDHSAWLEVGLRASPDVVSRYENLYRDYADVWTDASVDDLGNVYSSQATLTKSLTGTAAQGLGSILEASSSIGRVDRIDLTQTVNTVEASGPAIFLGPADYGIDPARAVAIYNMTDRNECSRQVAVVWQAVGGQILEEARYEEVESFSRCRSESLPNGWWTGLELPRPSDQVAPGTVRTEGGHELEIYNGTPRLEELLLTGLKRFSKAGLAEPRFDTVTFEPSRRCDERSGRLLQDEDSRELFLCLFESDLCPGASACVKPSLSVRNSVLHELAHAWIIDHVDVATQDRLLQSTGRESWDDDSLPWVERGDEYAAEVISWGLLEEDAPMVRIGRPPCEELAASFELLTNTDSLRAEGDCGSS